ncbi:hypothetical protein HLH36_15095 [Gluconacetobacter aggeris]|uniref:Uncharacterized protein n=1 Tax=Gluconacetobacter aggeris TaxID=1286186 RepID=A0A7W4IVF9_9PROT|nr:hypothetical protein [Gluconacetobacter aggeris]MBB2169658.1 hypothetical protein [Gluconacetobacter aggeris]
MLQSLLHILSKITRQTSVKESPAAEPLPIIIGEIVRNTMPDRRSEREKRIGNFLLVFVFFGLYAPILFSFLLLWPWFRKESEEYLIIPWTIFGVTIVSLLFGLVCAFVSLRTIVGIFRDVHKWPLLYAEEEFKADRIYIERLRRSTLADLQTARRTYGRKFDGLAGRATLLGGDTAKVGLLPLAIGPVFSAWQLTMKPQTLDKWPSYFWMAIIVAVSFYFLSFIVAGSAEKRVRVLDLLDQTIEERKTGEEP